MENPESQIAAIVERNKRVETDKAWEVSWTRRLLITALTYSVAVLFLWTIENPGFWLNAAVPALGYLLSTLSLPWVKQWWIRQHLESSQ
ncbi:MAG TPA: hypothetical protein DEB30_02765 [Candidatus Peribacter riflensis]|uniref:2TM domain-containing protein n=1 Tax=Candidatus Peribacter riflensis TaxID=1735162 RepID=A0A0S1SV73_9BACT|nr:MAG: Uncharacterized protein PeribacterA2_0567 [Candidatus Peribacter riflensis]OGJ77096.1 MAG: hypothetical protein A2398_03165 [Candidatus Peribacteria bacterium RIFOXYB1_FULL_57_12]OGJ79031.1 MAG: hypothetical protein A2412_00535 [Candidatus Peribacteria bacterium RIFOXYC1_FULL_58_8]ALM11045.1 MAG: Uncharacterized protein PeribacterB2_0566 [Candidatus Peribacter riflensis]ALM12148.1 MAG: Uncharacterized protein PeribacterC2_0566 [Candidatus Peribacter riflensis]